MTDGPQQPTDAPQLITSDPNKALHELFGLAQTNPAEFHREVDQINKTTNLSFLANGKPDMQIVGFENPAVAGGAHRLVMQNKNDQSYMETRFTGEGVVLPASTGPTRLDFPSTAGVPHGEVTRGPNTYDFNYPGGRHIHLDIAANGTPMRYTEGNETFVRQLINGQPSHLWVDQNNPSHKVLMEISLNKANGSLNMRFGDQNGNVIGSSVYNLDGSKLNIYGDVNAARNGPIRSIVTPDGHVIEPINSSPSPGSFPGQMGAMVQSFKDESGDIWQWQGQEYVDNQNRRRRDVDPVPGGAVAVRQGNILTTYETNGNIEKYVSP